MHVDIRRATLDEILPLRHRELRPGRPLHAARFDGDDEPDTRHFAAQLADGTVVGCASFMARPWNGAAAWQLRGMATRADLARRGIGSRLLGFGVPALQAERGDRPFWCNARLSAVGFYERQGWTIASPRFEIADVGPHHVMVRR